MVKLAYHMPARAVGIGDTPKHVTYHAETGCALVVCEDLYGNSWLRLFHATSLRQVTVLIAPCVFKTIHSSFGTDLFVPESQF